MTLSSSLNFRISEWWYFKTVCITELAINTITADSTIGTQSAIKETMPPLLFGNMVWKREIPNRHARAYLRSAAPVKHQLKSDPNVSMSAVLFLGAKSSSPLAGHLPLEV